MNDYIAPTLFGNWQVTEPHAGETITERAAAFHAANPHVYDALKTLSLVMRRRGRNRWSINGAFEVLRWQHALQTNGDEFKLNNNYRAFYARLLMDEPELAGFFEVRECK